MKLLLFLLIFLVPPLLQAEIFRWVDEQGNVHFSDQNQKGSKPVELRPATVIGTRVDPSAQNRESSPQTKQDTAVLYDSVKIVNPTNDESIRLTGEGSVNVVIESSPGLATGDSYRLSMDGEVIESDLTSGSIPLDNVARGSHTLAVEIIGKSGTSLIGSEEITFHVLRVSAPRPALR